MKMSNTTATASELLEKVHNKKDGSTPITIRFHNKEIEKIDKLAKEKKITRTDLLKIGAELAMSELRTKKKK
jgi:hypothetical protein